MDEKDDRTFQKSKDCVKGFLTFPSKMAPTLNFLWYDWKVISYDPSKTYSFRKKKDPYLPTDWPTDSILDWNPKHRY